MANKTQKTRTLNDKLLNRFKTGDLNELVEVLSKHPQFMLNFRGHYATIYYKGLRLLEIKKAGNFSITKKYLDCVVNDAEYSKYMGIYNNYNSSKQKNAENFEWFGFLSFIARGIDEWRSQHKKQPEKEIQQRIVLENNKFGDSQATDYFIVDTEYTEPGAKDGGRFDAIALHWSRDMRKSRDYKPALAFIEVKCNQGAIGGTSGVQKHLQDVVKYKITDKFYTDLENMIANLRELKLISIPGKKRLEIDRQKKPQMIFALANYNPQSSVLYDNIKDIKEPADIDVLFATSSFIGYGMYDEHMVKLEDFKKMIKPAK